MSFRRRGFTLVELLVVTGIIGVLLAIGSPVLCRSREHANRIKCAANLRSIGHAMSMYTQQYGYYPACALYRNDRCWALWPVRLRPFLGFAQEVFKCPAQDERCEWEKGPARAGAELATAEFIRFGFEVGEPLLTDDSDRFSYGYNSSGTNGLDPPPDPRHAGLGSILALIRGGPPAAEFRASRVRAPAEMIVVVDSMVDGRWDFAAVPNYPDPRLWPGNVHGGGANTLFCDGHVTWYAQQDLLVTYNKSVPSEEATRRRWNNNHEPNW